MSKVSPKSLVAFPLLTEAAEFLKALPEDWCVGGGWALDLFQRKVTRKHQDLDLCVLSLNKTPVVRYFLDRGWRVEAKLGRGFVPIPTLSDWSDQMPYLWASAPGSDFLPSYLDDQGIRKLRYERKEQLRMDFAELYFAQIENGCTIYPQNASIRRPIRQAVLEHAGFRFLAPEWVSLFKADWPKDKDLDDLNRVWSCLSDEQKSWLTGSLRRNHPEHPWLGRPPLLQHRVDDES